MKTKRSVHARHLAARIAHESPDMPGRVRRAFELCRRLSAARRRYDWGGSARLELIDDELLDELGYQGWVGCEYKPATTTAALAPPPRRRCGPKSSPAGVGSTPGAAGRVPPAPQ